jgi:plasmid stabilization system protein ParE
MKYRVRFHPAVSRDLQGIATTMLPHAGRHATLKVIGQLREGAASLQHTPHRGSLRDDILPGLRAIPAARRGVIVFTVDDQTLEVLVLVIAYGGADWEARLPRRR